MRSPRLRIYFFLALLTITVGIVTNVATSQIPTWLHPYLWLSWPVLGVMAFLFVILSVREVRERDQIQREHKLTQSDEHHQHKEHSDRSETIDFGQQVHFCTTSDGVSLAYAMIGEGPVLVKAANWLTHLDFDWRIPMMRNWLEELSRHHRLIRYDTRGCGLSDWDVDDLSFDAWVRDLETIVQTLNLDQFSLFGMSQGGPVAIAYAVKHPGKVRNLILYGSYARGVAKHDLDDRQISEMKAMHTMVERWWGRDNPAFRQFYSTLFVPEASEELMSQFNELQRLSTSPDNAVKFLKEYGNIDVRDLASMVSVPTLILHSRDDSIAPFKEGRDLASLIPNSQFVPLESKNHILLEGEPAWYKFVDEFRHFMGIEEGC